MVEVWALVAFGGSVVAAVAASWFARRAQRFAESSDVVELAKHVEKIARSQRSDTMRRVRAAAAAPVEAGATFPAPELVQPDLPNIPPQGADIHALKQQLRRQYLR